MRTLIRTTLITAIVVFGALLAWSLFVRRSAAPSAQAAAGTSIPAHCVADYVERSAKAHSPAAQQAASQAELQCAAEAQGYPARKKTALAKFTPPAPVFPDAPYPTETLQAGLQNGDYVEYTADPFLVTGDGNNLWGGIVNGKTVQVYTGALRDDNWQDHPELLPQGVLKVAIDHLWTGTMYPTPSRHGEIHFIAACGTKLIIQATDGALFAFDAATLSYLKNIPACPTATP